MQYPTKICQECDGTGVVTIGLDDDERECFQCGGMGDYVDVYLYRDANGILRATYPSLD